MWFENCILRLGKNKCQGPRDIITHFLLIMLVESFKDLTTSMINFSPLYCPKKVPFLGHQLCMKLRSTLLVIQVSQITQVLDF